MAESVYMGLMTCAVSSTQTTTAKYSNVQTFIPMDSDGDGLKDYDELKVHNSDPSKADTDGDGLVDGLEIQNGLNPNLADSDGNGIGDLLEADSDNDGISDAEEINKGTDPVRANLPLEDGWIAADIGAPALEGFTARYAENTEIFGTGHDIGGTRDSFHFLHKEMDGDFEFTARLASQEATHAWARTGLLIRKDSTESSSYISLFRTLGKGIETAWRNGADQQAYRHRLSDEHGLDAPVWFKMIRSSNEIYTFVSSNSIDWIPFHTHGLPTAEFASGKVLVGLAVSAINQDKYAKSVFSNISLKDLADTDGDGLADIIETSTTKTDPNLVDTDGDGSSDLEEVQAQTDPLRADLSLSSDWTVHKLGNSGLDAKATAYANGVIRIFGSGNGFYNKEVDAGTYLYQKRSGDFQVTAKMDAIHFASSFSSPWSHHASSKFRSRRDSCLSRNQRYLDRFEHSFCTVDHANKLPVMDYKSTMVPPYPSRKFSFGLCL